MNRILGFIILIFMISCEPRENPIFSVEEDLDKLNLPEEKVSNNQSEFSLSSFSNFPEGSEGCSCYFSLTKNAFKDGQYIYGGSLDDVGYIKKEGEWVYLNQYSNPQSDNSIHIRATNDSLEIEITGIKDSSAYETIQYKGDLKVLKNNVEIFSGEVYGECGC